MVTDVDEGVEKFGIHNANQIIFPRELYGICFDKTNRT